MLALQRPKSGDEKEEDDTLCDGRQLQEEPCPSSSIGDLHHLVKPDQAQIRSVHLKGHLVQKLVEKSFYRRRLPPFPNPRQSIGGVIETSNRKIKGKVWAAEGPAKELFENQIRLQIEKFLHNIDPPHCAPLFLELYIIGKKETSANPIVMICCSDLKARKDAEALIRGSDILQQFPYVGLGNCEHPLESKASVQPATEEFLESQEEVEIRLGFEVHGLGEPVIGRPLRLVEHENNEGTKAVRFATGGPFVRIENHIYQLTAFHYGQGDAVTGPIAQLNSDPDACEYDGQSDTEEDESNLEEETSEESTHEETCSTEMETRFTSPSMVLKSDLFSEKTRRQDPWSLQNVTDVDRNLLSRSNIDYFLVRLPTEEVSKASNAIRGFESHSALLITDISASPEPGTQVVVATSCNLLTGTILPGTKRVKMHGFRGFQDLLTARLSCSIKTGDSGSAVIDATTGCLYGHIVLGSTPDTLVYIVPSANIFTSVNAIFGKPPTLDLEGSIMNPWIPRKSVDKKEHRMSASHTSLSTQTPPFVSSYVRQKRLGQVTNSRDSSESTKYLFHPLSDFEPGKVFQIHDLMAPYRPSEEAPGSVRKNLNQFIVIRTHPASGLLSCCRICTYDKLGCTKDGVRPQDHGIIHESDSQPMRLPGEPVLGFSPIRLDATFRGLVSSEARVDYSRLLTIKHTFEVSFIGMIVNDDWPTFEAAFLGYQKKLYEVSERRHRIRGKESESTSPLGGKDEIYVDRFEFPSTYSDQVTARATNESGRYSTAAASWKTHEGASVSKPNDEQSRQPSNSNSPPRPPPGILKRIDQQADDPFESDSETGSLWSTSRGTWSPDIQRYHAPRHATPDSEVQVSSTTGQTGANREKPSVEQLDQTTSNDNQSMHNEDRHRQQWEEEHHDGDSKVGKHSEAEEEM